MSRRRYISTNISIDKKINTLATEYGDFAALLYTWMIPHAGDDATLTGDPDELLAIVIPMRRDKSAADVEQALAAMESLGLIERDGEGGQISFPSESFYRYQSYIKDGGRRGAKNSAGQEQSAQDSAQNNSSNGSSANQRKSAQNASSVPSSSSFSLPSSVPSSARCGEGDGFDPTADDPLEIEKAAALSANPHWKQALAEDVAKVAKREPIRHMLALELKIIRRWVAHPSQAPPAPPPKPRIPLEVVNVQTWQGGSAAVCIYPGDDKEVKVAAFYAQDAEEKAEMDKRMEAIHRASQERRQRELASAGGPLTQPRNGRIPS